MNPNPYSSIQHSVRMHSTQTIEFDQILNAVTGRRVFLVDENETWLKEKNLLPSVAELKAVNYNFQSSQTAVCMGDFIFLKTNAAEILNYKKYSLRYLFDATPENILQQFVVGSQLIRWSESHYFCASCSATLKIHGVEIAKACERCGRIYYPQVQPVAITLIYRHNQKNLEFLLARGLPPREHYSCIAGFVEPGESLENCLRREVLEEVGVMVKNISYFGSQIWPFPSQLMVGYFAEWDSGEIHIDPNEISHANWFAIDQLPLIPPHLSIARKMIEAARKNYVN